MPFSRLFLVLTLTGVALSQTAVPGSSNAPSGQPSSAPPAAQSPAQTNGQATQSPAPAPTPGASDAERERSGADPLLDMPPLPNHSASLIGGTVAKLDRIRDRMAVRPFGGAAMNIAFDMRTKIFRDNQPGTVHDLKPGSRVYVDTILNGDQVFARSIRVITQAGQGDAHGQIVAYDARRQTLTLHEEVSPQPVKLRITPQTTIQTAGKPGSLSDLQPGSLVVVHFQPGGDNRDVAQAIRILASPGATFTFSGTVTFLDLRARRIAIDNRTDNQNYDISVDSVPTSMLRDLKVGSEATVTAVFDGHNYQAHSIEIARRAATQNSEQQ